MVLSTCLRIFNCILLIKSRAGISAMLKLLQGIVFSNNTVRVLRQDKTREDIYYHNMASSISGHAVSQKNASQGVPN